MIMSNDASLSKGVFEELAAATWRHIYGDDQSPPAMPTRSEVEEALKDGDLDDGVPELGERLQVVGNVECPIDVLEAIADKYPLAIPLPLVMLSPHINAIAAIADEDTHIMNRRTLILLFMDTIHGLWQEMRQYKPDLKHPVAPLIEHWLKRPVQIEPSRKRAGILPAGLRGARALGYLPGLAPEEAPLGNQEQEAVLPGFAAAEGTIVPTAIVQTWARGGGTELTRGRGAPLSKRIFYEVLTELSLDARRLKGRVRLDLTLRDLRDWLYPRDDGKRHNFRPQRNITQIRDALWEVDQMRIKVLPPGDKVPTNWRVIGVRAFPEAHLDSRVVFDIELPPGSSGGALIDRYAMRRYGLVSAPQHSASLGLAYYWDRYGTYNGRRILATRPRVARNEKGNALGVDGQVILDQRQKPVAGFSDERMVFLNGDGRPVQARTLTERRKLAARERNPATDRYPVLLADDLLMLCYPESAATLNVNMSRKSRNLRFKRLERTKEALEQMEHDGYCVIESAAGELGEAGHRIMPTVWADLGL